MMNQKNLIIVAVVLVGGYYIYKMYYTKPKTTIKPKLPITEPIRDKGEPIPPTPTSESSFDSFDDDGL
jgi:hypothetical protein